MILGINSLLFLFMASKETPALVFKRGERNVRIGISLRIPVAVWISRHGSSKEEVVFESEPTLLTQ